VQEDINLEGDLDKAIPGAFTKRILWREAQGQYDPPGLLCVFTILFKISMQSLLDEEEGTSVGGDEPVPANVESDFRAVLQHLKDFKKVDFPHSIWPKPRSGPVKGKPKLLIFGDGSVEASCVLAYVRWELEDGPVVCPLLAGKTRVAPRCKISIPRMEHNTCIFPPCPPPPHHQASSPLLGNPPPPPPQSSVVVKAGTSLALGLRQGCSLYRRVTYQI
jgi:hypothetical protein